ncbi:hypothetical protein [Rosenbergiella epipactidis]|uniref:hypothetical protein n=1 Tax=Rosenbergiella epipactidis TaxID=1544694 RepID=UPI001F4D4751|nr:hypothetical protein [Rosenbergiella epipactidis]
MAKRSQLKNIRLTLEGMKPEEMIQGLDIRLVERDPVTNEVMIVGRQYYPFGGMEPEKLERYEVGDPRRITLAEANRMGD